MQVAYIKKEKCNTAMCNRCVKFCPASRKDSPVIYIGRNKKAMVVEELCNGCGRCVRVCPEKAIEMRFRTTEQVNPTEDISKAAEIVKSTEETKPANPKAPEEAKQTAPTPEPEQPKRKETPEEKVSRLENEHVHRIIRTGTAIVLGIIAGIVSFFIGGAIDPTTGAQPNAFVGLLAWLVAVVIQKMLFMLMKIDVTKLGKKDWFYQGFMTFCAWGIVWTVMLTTSFVS